MDYMWERVEHVQLSHSWHELDLDRPDALVRQVRFELQ